MLSIIAMVLAAIAIFLLVWFTLSDIEEAVKEKDTHRLVAECVTLLAICILLT